MCEINKEKQFETFMYLNVRLWWLPIPPIT